MVGDQGVKSGRLGFISQTMGDHWSFYGRFYFIFFQILFLYEQYFSFHEQFGRYSDFGG